MTTPAPRWKWPLLLALLAGSAGLALFGDKPPDDLVLPVRGAAPDASARPAPNPAPAPAAPQSSQARTTRPPGPGAGPEQPPPADTPHALVDRASYDANRSGSARRSTLFAVIQDAPAPAPPAPPAPAPPPAPPPPPPPFVYQGKQFDGQRWSVFLGLGEQTLIVQQGSMLAGQYRVERIAPPTLTLTDLAQARAHSIAIGEAP